MNELSFKMFCWAVVLGMGFHLGYGLIAILFSLLASAVGTHLPVLTH